MCSSGIQSVRLRHGARVCIAARRRPPAECRLRCVLTYLPHTCRRMLSHGRLITMPSGEEKRETDLHMAQRPCRDFLQSKVETFYNCNYCKDQTAHIIYQ